MHALFAKASEITDDAIVAVLKSTKTQILDCLLVEVKTVETVHVIHETQLLSHVKLFDYTARIGRHFPCAEIYEGVSRLLSPAANLE